MHDFMFKMGTHVTNPQSGYNGIIVGRAEYASHKQYLVQADNLTPANKPCKVWIDEAELS